MSFTREIYRLGFEISPVILTDGIASGITGGMLPVVALTQSASFVTGLITGSASLTDLDQYFCHWQPGPGGTLIDYDIATYPFANQNVAANAILKKPLRIPMIMKAPVNSSNGAMTKLVTLSALQAVLESHASLGGTYIVATPAAIFENCILKTVMDITGQNEKIAQSTWQFMFEKPLITENQAASALNNMLNGIDLGSKLTSSAWTTAQNALGNTDLGNTIKQITGLVGSLGGN
ncbi:hypothetical protein [Mangrovibacter phragmitis]|uniref:hypothetical protein n=1 Tax=Mangrovibacter phragmitis TaxID=1691903 RepID=UPI00336A7040